MVILTKLLLWYRSSKCNRGRRVQSVNVFFSWRTRSFISFTTYFVMAPTEKFLFWDKNWEAWGGEQYNMTERTRSSG